MMEVIVFGVRGNWNEKTYSSTLAGKKRIYVGKNEYHLTPEQIENLVRFESDVRPEKPTTAKAMASSKCPKCGGYCYGDCSVK